MTGFIEFLNDLKGDTSAEALARRTGVSSTQLRRFLRGDVTTRPHRETFEKLAGAGGVSADALEALYDTGVLPEELPPPRARSVEEAYQYCGDLDPEEAMELISRLIERTKKSFKREGLYENSASKVGATASQT